MSLTLTPEELESRYQGGAESLGFPRMAEALLREGQIEEAISLAQRGINHFPRLLSGFLVLGRSLQKAGRLDEAKSHFERALVLDPRCPSARLHLAQIAEQLQWKSMALEHYRVLCEIEPWDEGIREAYGRMVREAPGGQPSPKLLSGTETADLPPLAGAQNVSEAEYRLDEVGDFLPKDDGFGGDLASALPTGSEWDVQAMTQATFAGEDELASTSTGISARAPSEPNPMDILREEDAPLESAAQGEPPPISGVDVENRLDDIFGLAQETAFVSPSEAYAPPLETPFQPEMPPDRESQGEILPQAGEATTYAEAGETGFLESGSPVAGDDIAERLDDLFDLGSTETPGLKETPVEIAPPLSLPDEAVPEAGIEESQDAASAVIDEAPVFAMDNAPAPGVTGDDIADRLDSLFDDSASESSLIHRLEPDAEDYQALSLETEFGEKTMESEGPLDFGEANTLYMPAMRDDDMDSQARETMIISADSLLNFQNDAPAAETSPADTPAFLSESIDTVDLKPESEAGLFENEAALAMDGAAGNSSVVGDDVGQRLDDLFGIEPEGTEVKSDVMETSEFDISQDSRESGNIDMEATLADAPDLSFAPEDQGETMVSGDDISSRLAEIFGEGDAGEAKSGIAYESAMEEAARGTHIEPVPTDAFGALGQSDSDAEALSRELPENQEDEETFEPGTTSIATVTLAEIYFNQGLKEQALQIYRQLQEREPDNESVLKRILEIEASKADGDDKGSGPDDSRPRPGLKIPRRKK